MTLDPGPRARVVVLIPALNEERSLPRVLAALGALAGDPPGEGRPERRYRIEEVLVVNNGSTDRTAEVARAGGARVIEERSRGYGRACLSGLAALATTPHDIVVFLDADFSDDPSRLPRLVEPIAAGRRDMVLGSRRLGECEPGALLPQARWGNAVCVAFIHLLYGFRYSDLGPFRAISREALARLSMADRGYGWTAEMQVKALLAGLRVEEISVPYRRRIGTSKITGTLSGTVRAGGRILWTIASLRRWRPAPPPDPAAG